MPSTELLRELKCYECMHKYTARFSGPPNEALCNWCRVESHTKTSQTKRSLQCNYCLTRYYANFKGTLDEAYCGVCIRDEKLLQETKKKRISENRNIKRAEASQREFKYKEALQREVERANALQLEVEHTKAQLLKAQNLKFLRRKASQLKKKKKRLNVQVDVIQPAPDQDVVQPVSNQDVEQFASNRGIGQFAPNQGIGQLAPNRGIGQLASNQGIGQLSPKYTETSTSDTLQSGFMPLVIVYHNDGQHSYEHPEQVHRYINPAIPNKSGIIGQTNNTSNPFSQLYMDYTIDTSLARRYFVNYVLKKSSNIYEKTLIPYNIFE